MKGMLQSFAQLLIVIILLVLFGYFETKTRGSGIVVGVLVVTYQIFFTNTKLIPILLLATEIGFLYIRKNEYSYVVYLLQVLYVSRNSLAEVPDKITLRPYEKEIRQLLLKKGDTTMLAQVDKHLDKYRGHEKELYSKFLEKYQDVSPGVTMNIPPTPTRKLSVSSSKSGKQAQSTTDQVVAEITDLLRQHQQLSYLETLLSQYKGREAQLLQDLHMEYDDGDDELPDQDDAKSFGGSAAPSSMINRPVIDKPSKDQAILEKARADARMAIEKRMQQYQYR